MSSEVDMEDGLFAAFHSKTPSQEGDRSPRSGQGSSGSLLEMLSLIENSGPLRASDMECYRAGGAGTWKPVNRLSHRHHRMAQLVALGYSNREIAMAMRLSDSHVSLILHSPAFVNLAKEYQDQILTKDHAFQMELCSVRDMSLDQVKRDLESELIRGKDALAVLKETADRTGHGPSSTLRTENNTTSQHFVQVMIAKHEARKAKIIPLEEIKGDAQMQLPAHAEPHNEEAAGRTPVGSVHGPLPAPTPLTSAHEPQATLRPSLREQDREEAEEAPAFKFLHLQKRPVD